MEDNSVDSIVTDPPYGLSAAKNSGKSSCGGFMGKKWDYDVPSVDIWVECLRVLKPGGHLLAFAGTRTQHRMCVNIEDAGFEIRDMIAWVYGCLDEQTQLVTPDGPRPYHSAKAGDPVLCYDAEAREYNYQPIQDVVVYDYSDTAYRLVGDHGEQVVSRNHRCLVERSGSEAFQLAETLEQQARVPVLEDLPALQQALRNAHQGAGGQEQDLQQGMRIGVNRQGKQRPHANRAAQAEPGGVRSLRRRSAQAQFMAEAHRCADVQPAMQRQAQGRGMEAARQQGAEQLAARVGAGFGRADDWRHQPGMERRAHLSQPQGSLCRSGDPVRALPCGPAEHGEEGWLRDGAPATGGSGDRPTAHQHGSRASRQPRRDGQPAGKSDAVCDERPAQGVRAWSGHRTTVVRVEPFHYTGKVWCLKVPTGCFVAWRDGMAFPTGNSGFPKSLDVSKAIDKHGGDPLAWQAFSNAYAAAVAGSQLTHSDIDRALGIKASSCYWARTDHRGGMPPRHHWEAVRKLLQLPDSFARLYDEAEREVVGQKPAGIAKPGERDRHTIGISGTVVVDITAPATEAAKQWDGWGTSLKPALEPITVARKPFKGNVAANVLQHGTGAINIDGCRVGDNSKRWPANLIHDGSDEVTELLGDSGSAARFFYQAKCSRKDRGEGNTHPTVKPTDLMRYLCRLVTPPGGIVLDPFMGSGSTGKAALLEGFQFIGIERDPDYFAMAQQRLNETQLGFQLL